MTMSPAPEPLPTRWAVILLIAAMIALAVGGLTFVQTDSLPASLLTALTAGGAAVPGMHRILGKQMSHCG